MIWYVTINGGHQPVQHYFTWAVFLGTYSLGSLLTGKRKIETCIEYGKYDYIIFLRLKKEFKSWLYVFQIRAKNIFLPITYHRNFSFHRRLFFSKLCCIYRNKNIERIHLPSSLPNTFHIVLGSYGTGLSHICRNDDLLVFRGCPDASRWSSIYLQLMV